MVVQSWLDSDQSASCMIPEYMVRRQPFFFCEA